MRLRGKVALVTGSSRGIGRGIAVEMAKAGACVTVNYNTHPDEAQETAEAVRQAGSKAIVCQADVANRAQVDRMVEATVREFGKVDICVCNAARGLRKPFLELTNEEFQRTVDVTLVGVFNCSQACAREMVKRGEGGAVLFISSVLAFIPKPTTAPYNACKAGINHMAATMAEEFLPHRIRVNVIEPGWIDTPGERKWVTQKEIDELGKLLPWGRLGTAEDIGKAAAFLCSPDADYITAATLRIDGGFWLPSCKLTRFTGKHDSPNLTH
jgi:glucose 1-dehydrogenase